MNEQQIQVQKTEKEILTKFKDGAEIKTDEEMEVLERWALTGLAKFGTDLVNMRAEAKLTKKGRHHLAVI